MNEVTGHILMGIGLTVCFFAIFAKRAWVGTVLLLIGLAFFAAGFVLPLVTKAKLKHTFNAGNIEAGLGRLLPGRRSGECAVAPGALRSCGVAPLALFNISRRAVPVWGRNETRSVSFIGPARNWRSATLRAALYIYTWGANQGTECRAYKPSGEVLCPLMASQPSKRAFKGSKARFKPVATGLQPRFLSPGAIPEEVLA
jgi:hypothetical protein